MNISGWIDIVSNLFLTPKGEWLKQANKELVSLGRTACSSSFPLVYYQTKQHFGPLIEKDTSEYTSSLMFLDVT